MKLTEDGILLDDRDACINCKCMLWNCKRLKFLRAMAIQYKLEDEIVYAKCPDKELIG